MAPKRSTKKPLARKKSQAAKGPAKEPRRTKKATKEQDEDIARLVALTKKLANTNRMTVLVRLLSAPERTLSAGAAWPPNVSNPMRTDYLKAIAPFLDVERPSRIKDAIYSIRPTIAPHLRAAIDAIRQLDVVATEEKGAVPQQLVAVSLGEEGQLLINGDPVDDDSVADALRDALSPEMEED